MWSKFNRMSVRPIGQYINRWIHFPTRTHPRNFPVSPDVRIFQYGYTHKHSQTQPSELSWRSGWSQPERVLVKRREEEEEGEAGRPNPRGGSGTGVPCFYSKSPWKTHPPSIPGMTLRFTLLSNKPEQWAVSCFNSLIPSSHYAPNYCHPIHQFLCYS